MAKKKAAASPKYEAFEHCEATSPMRPDVGTQAAFKKKPPVTYRYDSSLSPALDWDGQNPAREQGEAILAELGRQLAEIRLAIEDPGLEPALRGVEPGGEIGVSSVSVPKKSPIVSQSSPER